MRTTASTCRLKSAEPSAAVPAAGFESELGPLVLTGDQRAQLACWAAREYPREACGLLIGSARADGAVCVREVSEARNLERERAGERYDLDPGDQLRAEERARALGLDVVGVWHSHPDRAARPSPADRRGAWACYSYLIVSVRAGRPLDLRSWSLRGDAFVEQPIDGGRASTSLRAGHRPRAKSRGPDGAVC